MNIQSKIILYYFILFIFYSTNFKHYIFKSISAHAFKNILIVNYYYYYDNIVRLTFTAERKTCMELLPWLNHDIGSSSCS